MRKQVTKAGRDEVWLCCFASLMSESLSWTVGLAHCEHCAQFLYTQPFPTDGISRAAASRTELRTLINQRHETLSSFSCVSSDLWGLACL